LYSFYKNVRLSVTLEVANTSITFSLQWNRFFYFDHYIQIRVYLPLSMHYIIRTTITTYRGYSSFSMNTWFIFIEWYENKCFMSGGSHEWNNVIFMPQYFLCIYRKNLNFLFIIYIFLFFDIKIWKISLKFCELTEL
jgi:hypothetical protein